MCHKQAPWMLSSGVGIQVFVQRMGSFVVGLASRRAGFVLVRNAGPYVPVRAGSSVAIWLRQSHRRINIGLIAQRERAPNKNKCRHSTGSGLSGPHANITEGGLPTKARGCAATDLKRNCQGDGSIRVDVAALCCRASTADMVAEASTARESTRYWSTKAKECQ